MSDTATPAPTRVRGTTRVVGKLRWQNETGPGSVRVSSSELPLLGTSTYQIGANSQ